MYTEQARRIEEAYRTAVESNAAAFEQALRTIITVLGPAGTDAGGNGSGSSPRQQQLQEGGGGGGSAAVTGAPLVMVPVPLSALSGGAGSSRLLSLGGGFGLGAMGGGGGGGVGGYQSPRQRQQQLGGGGGGGGGGGYDGAYPTPSGRDGGRQKRKYKRRAPKGLGEKAGPLKPPAGAAAKLRKRRGGREPLPPPAEAFLRGFEQYLSRHHISAFKGQPLAPNTVAVRVGQAQRLLRTSGLGALGRYPTEAELRRLEAKTRGENGYTNTVLDALAYLQWRDGPGAALEGGGGGGGGGQA